MVEEPFLSEIVQKFIDDPEHFDLPFPTSERNSELDRANPAINIDN